MKNNIKLLILLSCFSVYNINTLNMDSLEDVETDETPIDKTPIDETPIDETPIDETPAEKAAKEAAAEEAAEEAAKKQAADKTLAGIDKVSTNESVLADFDLDSVDVYSDTDGTQTSTTNDDTIEIDIDGNTYDPETGTITNKSGYSYQLSEDALKALGDSPTQEAVDKLLDEVMETNTDDDPFGQDASEVSEKTPNKTSPMQRLLDFLRAIFEKFFIKIKDKIEQSLRGTNKPAFDQVEGWSEVQIYDALRINASTVQGALKIFNLPKNYTIEDLNNAINNEALAKTQIESMCDETRFLQQIDKAMTTLSKNLDTTLAKDAAYDNIDLTPLQTNEDYLFFDATVGNNTVTGTTNTNTTEAPTVVKTTYTLDGKETTYSDDSIDWDA